MRDIKDVRTILAQSRYLDFRPVQHLAAMAPRKVWRCSGMWMSFSTLADFGMENYFIDVHSSRVWKQLQRRFSVIWGSEQKGLDAMGVQLDAWLLWQ